MFSRILLVAAMTLSAAACVGDVEDPGNDAPNPNPNGNTPAAKNAQKEYEDKVFPIVQGTCGGCHANASNPLFVGSSKTTAYNQMIGFTQVTGAFTTDSAGIYKAPAIPAHAGVVAYTADQQATISAWLALEATARAGGGGNPTPPGEESPGAASTRLVKAFQACMTTADFTASNFGPGMSGLGSTDGNCVQCHNQGLASMIANTVTGADGTAMFTVLKTSSYYLATYFTPNTLTKPYKMTFNQAAFDRVANRRAPHQDHPAFNATNSAGIIAAKSFLDKTIARLDATGNCATPPAP
jgi:hypothetical protein